MENVNFWKLSPALYGVFKAGFLLEGNFTAENVEGCSRGVFKGCGRILDTITHGEYNRSGEEAAKKGKYRSNRPSTFHIFTIN